MNDLINKITDKIEFLIGNKNIAGNDVNISKHKMVIKEINLNVFTNTEKNNETINSIILKTNERIDRINNKLDSLNLEPNIKSVAHYEDIDNFIKLGLRSDMDIVDFLTDNIKKLVNSNQQSERNIIIDAEKFILNANESEICLLVWSWLYKAFLQNVIDHNMIPNWLNMIFVNEILKKVREKYPLKNNLFMPCDVITFAKIGCNPSNEIFNCSLTPKHISEKQNLLPYGITLEYIFSVIPEFNTKRPNGQDYLIGIDNLAAYLTKSLDIAAIYFLRKIGIDAKV